MSTQSEVADTFRTDDMAMVTYLRILGHPVQDVFWVDTVCYWRFLVSPSLLEAKEDFVRGLARVEPREFSKNYGTTKSELHHANPRPH